MSEISYFGNKTLNQPKEDKERQNNQNMNIDRSESEASKNRPWHTSDTEGQ